MCRFFGLVVLSDGDLLSRVHPSLMLANVVDFLLHFFPENCITSASSHGLAN